MNINISGGGANQGAFKEPSTAAVTACAYNLASRPKGEGLRYF